MNLQSSEEISLVIKSGLRIFQIFCLITIPVAILLLFILLQTGFQVIFSKQDPILVIIEGVFGGFSVLILFFGLAMPKLLKWGNNQRTTFRSIIIGHNIRISLFETITVYGFMLGLFGSAWYIAGAFLVLSGVLLISTFPTDSRLSKWKG